MSWTRLFGHGKILTKKLDFSFFALPKKLLYKLKHKHNLQLKSNRWLISNKIHSQKKFSALTGGLGLLANLKHKHKLQLKPNRWLISSKIHPNFFFFRALQPKRLRLFYSNLAHTFLLVLLTGGESALINTRSVKLNFSAYFNENAHNHWNGYFWHSNKPANCTDTFSRVLARCGVPIAMCVQNLNQIAPGVYAVWLPKKTEFWLKIHHFGLFGGWFDWKFNISQVWVI